MLDFLIEKDTELFLAINALNSDFFDILMYRISGQIFWIPFFASIIYLFFRKQKTKFAIIGLIFLIITIILADFTSVHAFKEVFRRLRPCHNEAIANVVHLVKGHCGGKYGFVSSHAANFFSLAMFSSLLIKNKIFTFFAFFFATIVAYSRIYLGVHYPGDVLGGAILGILMGFIFFVIFKNLFKFERRLN